MAGELSTLAAALAERSHGAGEWDAELVRIVSPVPLQQTWGWGEVQRRLGSRIQHVALPGGGLALVVLRGRGPFQWAHAPRGPVPANLDAVTELAAWARARRLALLRVEPEGPPSLGEGLAGAGFRQGPLSEPQHTVIVDLQDDERLLANYRKSTRYNLRTAERSGVVVEEVEDTDELSRLVATTYRRHGILMTTAGFNRALREVFDKTRVYLARLGAEPLAAILVARHGSRAYYLVGGSSDERRELMPNYLLQWRAMRDAYRDGCSDYDLCGIPPPGQPNHPWRGLYQFKTGFGGREVEYTGPWDLVLSPAAASILRRVRRVGVGAQRLGHRGRTLFNRRQSP
jgi:peptidoglycan pentaglycine glycine transferase (the first glycine)